ncbi:MAG: hypothetical protein GF328_00680, partial [Candidatus Latescibacteria bacterium]|nr:hypothetical protein [Candidatus Latescibacterota bacterium]
MERERSSTAHLVAHLPEMDRRRLHLELGYSSLYTYCTQALHLSEEAAYKRIAAARAARRFPGLLARLAQGELHLSSVKLLAPVLTRENHAELIEEARRKTKRQVEQIIARTRPAPPVPAVVERQIPAPVPAPAPASSPSQAPPTPSPTDAPPAVPTPPPRPVVAPLAPERYKVQFTASGEMHERLLRAQALLRHKVPDGDVAKIFDLALIALLERTEARKFGKRKTRRSTESRNRKQSKASAVKRKPPKRRANDEKDHSASSSRYIPSDVRRTVWIRDEGRCTFTSADGVRCTETGCLEFDHREPFACGGPATVENIRLVCRRHNQHYARQRFGPDAGRVREGTPPYASESTPSLVKARATGPGA